jgi:hypothetical protein
MHYRLKIISSKNNVPLNNFKLACYCTNYHPHFYFILVCEIVSVNQCKRLRARSQERTLRCQTY